jgi:hypothetical protein
MEYSEHVGTNLQLFGRRGDKLYLYSLIIVMSSVFIVAKPGKYFAYAHLQISKISLSRRASCNNNKVVSQGLVCKLLSEDFPQTAFNPVSNNGVPDFSAYSKAESAEGQFVW